MERREDLAEKSDAICRMGALMLSAGTGTYRVKAAMGRVAAALGVEGLEAQVGLSEIILTTRESGAFRTQIREVPVPAVNADRIAALLRVSLRAAPGMTAAQLHERLDRAEGRQPLYSHATIVLGTVLACAAFAFLNNGRWQECLGAALAAGIGKVAQLRLRRRRLNQYAIVAAASAVAGAFYLLFAHGLRAALPHAGGLFHDAAFVSAILFLVPGFPLVTAALDLARFDFTAGVARLVYSLLVILSAAVGAWMVAWATGLTPSEIEPLHLPLVAMAALWFVAGLAGVIGFAVTFNTPWRATVIAAVIGALGNTARLVVVRAGVNPLPVMLLTTTFVGLAAGYCSQRLPAPRIILSVPAVLIMIPGAPIYRALVAMINRDPLTALTNGFFGLSILVAICSGLVVARMLTDKAWIDTPEWTHMPGTRAQRKLREQA